MDTFDESQVDDPKGYWNKMTWRIMSRLNMFMTVIKRMIAVYELIMPRKCAKPNDIKTTFVGSSGHEDSTFGDVNKILSFKHILKQFKAAIIGIRKIKYPKQEKYEMIDNKAQLTDVSVEVKGQTQSISNFTNCCEDGQLAL